MRPARRLAAAWMSARASSGVAGRRLGLPQTVVAVVLHQAFDHLLRQQQPLAATAWAPLGQLLTHLLESHRLIAVGQENAEDCLERRHIAVHVVLGAATMLSNAL